MTGGKQPDIKPIPKSAPITKSEDESVQSAGNDELRRLRAMAGRNKTVTSQRGSILG